tara:strand:- start:988 stop:2232 length:1245 start_codon:yes stop_codon:yes gene_type:complete
MVRVLRKLASKLKLHIKKRFKWFGKRTEKNKEMYKYFIHQISNTNIITKRYFDRIYNFVVLNKNKTNPTISYPSHFDFNKEDLLELQRIIKGMEKIKNKKAGGGKKLKFIQSGGVMTGDAADALLGAEYLSSDNLENKASLYLVQLFEITSILNNVFNDFLKEKIDDEEDYFISFQDEVEAVVDEDDVYLNDIFGTNGYVIQTQRHLFEHLNNLKTKNANFYNICLNDIYKDINIKLEAEHVVSHPVLDRSAKNKRQLTTQQNNKKKNGKQRKRSKHRQPPRTYLLSPQQDDILKLGVPSNKMPSATLSLPNPKDLMAPGRSYNDLTTQTDDQNVRTPRSRSPRNNSSNSRDGTTSFGTNSASAGLSVLDEEERGRRNELGSTRSNRRKIQKQPKPTSTTTTPHVETKTPLLTF